MYSRLVCKRHFKGRMTMIGTKTVTILFADIKGFSKLDLRQKLTLREVIETELLDAIVREVERDNIKHYNSWGDAYLILFNNVNAGVKAALTLRDQFLSRTNWTELGLPPTLNIRCSLHVGDVVIKDFENPIVGTKIQDVVGENIDLTARIEPITPPGRVWATQQVYTLLPDNPPDGVQFDPIGKLELAKGWGIRSLYDVRRVRDEKIDILDIPDMDNKVIINKSDINVLKDPPGILIMLCGPSAVGKDAIASRMRGRLDQLGIEAQFPQKYTTRPIRKQEDTPIDGRWFEPSSQYEFLTDDELNTREDIIGKYDKFGYSYGFDKKEFKNKGLMNKFLICIYGDLYSLADFKKEIEEKYARKVFVVFLQAPDKDLFTRLDTRPGMPGDVIEIRKKEMIRDIARLERMHVGGDYIRTDNSNMDNPDEVSEKLLRIVLEEIGYLT